VARTGQSTIPWTSPGLRGLRRRSGRPLGGPKPSGPQDAASAVTVLYLPYLPSGMQLRA
jgi:hypothetical protein